ncbi:YcjX family protein [Dankookia sp. P2]|uniref:YcjX family protein n=1 Tax=Dankookia sp. P2 TaxID=3423955 RepID=UPI003D6694FD
MSGLLDPFGLLRDAAYGAERLGRSLIGQERIRLAVTGLTRAGKTVFLTSLLANLLAAGRGRRTLPMLEEAAGGRLRAVRPVPPGIEGLPRFNVAAHLAALAADPPAWPARTEDLSTLELTLELDRQSMLAGLLGTRGVTLELLDYPGEWLLDLPMLNQDFSGWSAATLARLRRPGHAAAMGESSVSSTLCRPASGPRTAWSNAASHSTATLCAAAATGSASASCSQAAC